MIESDNPNIRFETEQWVDRYSDYLYRYALLRLKDPTVAEDAVQETFLAALKNIHQFDGRVDVKYWLRGILRNKIVDHIRKSVRRRKLQEEEVHDVIDKFLYKASGVPTTRPKPWAFDPDAAFAQEEFWSAFQSCIETLKDPMKTAFTLKMLEEQDTEDICKELDITDNYLWVMLHRARSQLKDCLETKWSVT